MVIKRSAIALSAAAVLSVSMLASCGSDNSKKDIDDRQQNVTQVQSTSVSESNSIDNDMLVHDANSGDSQSTSESNTNASHQSGTDYDSPTQPLSDQYNQASANNANYISNAEAEDIALKMAGFTRTDTVGLHSELDTDDAVANYDIEFVVGEKEYGYEINAVTGDIIATSVEPVHD